jgi:predicted lipoprotein with Yx(FWY)xxD motif
MSSSRLRPIVLALVVAAAIPAAALAVNVDGMHPAIETTSNIGKVVATPTKLGIYYWDTEKKAKGKIKCTGECLMEWPAVYVKGPVVKHVKGVMATFGTIKRGTKLQLTVNGLPAYIYKGDKAGVVKCDGVNGWHAVRPAAG